MKNVEKDAMKDAAKQQSAISAEDVRFAKMLEGFGIEDRAVAQQIRAELGPVADKMMATFNPEASDPGPYPDRPDLKPYYQGVYKDQIADTADMERTSMANMIDQSQSLGLGHTGMPAMAAGGIAGAANTARTAAYGDLKDREAGEDIEGWNARLGKWGDLLAKRDSDVNIATTGANIKSGQQQIFNPNASFSGATQNRGQAISGYGQSAQTNYNAAQLPGTWSKVGGLVNAGLKIGADLIAPGSGTFMSRFKGAFGSK